MDCLTTTTNCEEVIIIDHGAHQIRAGLGNNLTPAVVSFSVSGTKRKTVGNCMMTMPGLQVNKIPDAYVYGDEAIANANLLRVEPTVEDRKTLKDSARKLYEKIFSQLGIESYGNVSVVYLVTSFADKIFLERVYEMFIREFKFKRLLFVPQSVILTDNQGIVIDIGETRTDLILVKSGKLLIENSFQLELGGSDMTNLLRMCYEDHEYFKYSSVMEIKKLKEKHLRIALDLDKETKEFNPANSVTLELEDLEYKFTTEFLDAGEVLFDISKIKGRVITPGTMDLIHGIKKIIDNSSEEDKDIMTNITLIGGCSAIPNLPERLKLELKKVYNDKEFIVELFHPEASSESFWVAAQKSLPYFLSSDRWINNGDELNYDKAFKIVY